MNTRPFPTGLPLVDTLRSCMLQNVPHGQVAGACSSLPYDAAELIHDLYDALLPFAAVADDPEGGGPITYADLARARTAVAKVRGEPTEK